MLIAPDGAKPRNVVRIVKEFIPQLNKLMLEFAVTFASLDPQPATIAGLKDRLIELLSQLPIAPGIAIEIPETLPYPRLQVARIKEDMFLVVEYSGTQATSQQQVNLPTTISSLRREAAPILRFGDLLSERLVSLALSGQQAISSFSSDERGLLISVQFEPIPRLKGLSESPLSPPWES